MNERSAPPEPAGLNSSEGSGSIVREAENWRSVLALIAEVLGISSVFAFALSCFANHLVFRAWGHDFLQLASPSDVIMSGTRILGLFLLPVLGGLGIALLFSYVWSNFNTFDKFVRGSAFYKGCSKQMKAIMRVSIAVAGVGLVLLAIAIGIYSWLFSGLFSIFIESSLSFALVFAGINGIMYVVEEFRLGEADKIIHSIFLVLSVFFMASGFNLLSDWFVRRVEEQAISGFHPQPLAVMINNTAVCPAKGGLLWSGSESVLVACNINGKRHVLVVRNAENALFVPYDVGNRQ